MASGWAPLGAWLCRRAENLLAAMLVAMFAAFLLQITFRYVLNLPIGWTNEISVVLWIWIVLFGAAFVVREEEEIRFDLNAKTLKVAGEEIEPKRWLEIVARVQKAMEREGWVDPPSPPKAAPWDSSLPCLFGEPKPMMVLQQIKVGCSLLRAVSIAILISSAS